MWWQIKIKKLDFLNQDPQTLSATLLLSKQFQDSKKNKWSNTTWNWNQLREPAEKWMNYGAKA